MSKSFMGLFSRGFTLQNKESTEDTGDPRKVDVERAGVTSTTSNPPQQPQPSPSPVSNPHKLTPAELSSSFPSSAPSKWSQRLFVPSTPEAGDRKKPVDVTQEYEAALVASSASVSPQSMIGMPSSISSSNVMLLFGFSAQGRAVLSLLFLTRRCLQGRGRHRQSRRRSSRSHGNGEVLCGKRVTLHPRHRRQRREHSRGQDM